MSYVKAKELAEEYSVSFDEIKYIHVRYTISEWACGFGGTIGLKVLEKFEDDPSITIEGKREAKKSIGLYPMAAI